MSAGIERLLKITHVGILLRVYSWVREEYGEITANSVTINFNKREGFKYSMKNFILTFFWTAQSQYKPATEGETFLF